MDIDAVLKKLTQKIDGGRIKENEPMKNHTSFRVGGAARVLILPESKQEILYALNCCREHGVHFFIMGKGSNLIVRDSGYNGVIIKLGDHYNRIAVNEENIIADAGALLSMIASAASENCLEGIEFASGIPGTLGGAVAMNAGAYGGEMSHIVKKAEVIDQDGRIIEIYNKDMNFGYRRSIIQEKCYVVLEAELALKKGDGYKIKGKIKELTARRNEKQPVNFPSAGSIFKRPEGFFAGRLIEEAGLKGLALGGARVSPLHAGFIVNEGNATAADILGLIDIIREIVLDKSGVLLETEVKVIGD